MSKRRRKKDGETEMDGLDDGIYRSSQAGRSSMIVVDSNIVTVRSLTTSLTSKAKQVEGKDPVWIEMW